jgi:hypothetical protein
MKTEFEIKIPGIDFVIKSNTIYTVIPKPDPNAPDGFKEHGTTKLIHPDVTTTVAAPFDVDMGVWDTGFYMFSPCLRGMSEAEKKAHVDNVKEHIVDKVEQIKGPGVLRHSADNTFYDDLPITLYNKVSFNTAEPYQLLMLYLVILGKDLAPKEYVGHPLFKKADYQVVNREKEITNKQQIEINKSKAIGEFWSLLKSDKPKLTIILSYLGISNTSIQDEDTFITVFTKFLEDRQDGYRNSKIFLDTLTKFTGDSGEEELYIYDSLNKLSEKGILKSFKQEYFLGDKNLGNSIKHAAMYASTNAEIKKLIMEASAEDEEIENE